MRSQLQQGYRNHYTMTVAMSIIAQPTLKSAGYAYTDTLIRAKEDQGFNFKIVLSVAWLRLTMNYILH